MTYKEVATMVGGLGLPYAYYQFRTDTAVAPPFYCFFFTGSNDLSADNENYQKIPRLVLEQYTREKDYAQEEATEAALRANGLVWMKSETPLDSEGMYMVIYEMDVVITPIDDTEESENA